LSDQRVRLPGSRRFQRQSADVLGPADPNELCEITIKVRRKLPLCEPEKFGQTADAGSVSLQQYWSAQSDIDKVIHVLTRHGLTIQASSLEGCGVKASGTVRQMDELFSVHLLHMIEHGRSFVGRVGKIQIPPELSGIVVGIFGLDNRQMAFRSNTTANSQPRPIPPGDQRPWFLPQELPTYYNFPPGDGAGQTIAILELGGRYDEAAFKQFAELTKLGNNPEVIIVNVDDVPPEHRDDAGEISEVMVDVQVLASVCPRASIVVYFCPFTEKGWVDILEAAVHDRLRNPKVISISWGCAEGEQIWTPQATMAVNDLLKEAALHGISVCVCSGDDGSDDQVGDGKAHVNFPASSPYVLSVGGTTLEKKNSVTVERPWKEGSGLRADEGGSSGGGVSRTFERPDWQKTSITTVNSEAFVGRCVPDVSANAARQTGYFVVFDGAPKIAGGTSAATPLWAGLIARINAALNSGRTVGYLTPLLYQPFQAGTVGAFVCNDITKGDNITVAEGGYSAGPGYDAVTGWGSPNGMKLLQYLIAAG
jgi:kumamolisin